VKQGRIRIDRREGQGEPARHAIVAGAFVVCAVVLGGGGSPNPGTEVLLQLAFAAAGLTWLWLPAPGGVPRPRSPAVWLICALALALPLLQLAPLPPGLWTSLPGQEDRVAALALVGREASWQPLSHAPSLTLASLLAIVPALFAFAATAALDETGRVWIVGTIAAMALLSALIGAVQLSLGDGGTFNLYAEFHRGVVTGFQANRNATADVLLIGMAATAAFFEPALAPKRRGAPAANLAILSDRKAAGVALASLLLVLFFATVLTASRTGIALIPLALLGVWLILRPALADQRGWRWLPAGVAAAFAALIVLGLLARNQALLGVTSRFDFTGEFRMELWRDAWFAMARAWPFGVGLGGVQPALIAAERLEVLDPLLPNRVHNDYLELALEAGVVGIAILLAIVATLGVSAWRTWRRQPAQRHLTACGLTMLAVAAAHSFVDYPLRSMALACLIGTGAGLLVATPRAPPPLRDAASGSDA